MLAPEFMSQTQTIMMVWGAGLPTQDSYDVVGHGFKIAFAFQGAPYHVEATVKCDAIIDSQERRLSSQDVVKPLG